MRTMDDIAVPLRVILALRIDGLPTDKSALLKHAKRNAWPIVYTQSRAGEVLFLVDGIPEPHGETIRDLLNTPRSFPPPNSCIKTVGCNLTRAEARMVILFEVFRRSIAVGQSTAIRTIVKDAREGNLPEDVRHAIPYALANGQGSETTITFDNKGIMPPALRWDETGTKMLDNPEGKRRWDAAIKNNSVSHIGTGRFTCLSFSTINRWIGVFNTRGASGLL